MHHIIHLFQKSSPIIKVKRKLVCQFRTNKSSATKVHFSISDKARSCRPATSSLAPQASVQQSLFLGGFAHLPRETASGATSDGELVLSLPHLFGAGPAGGR